MASSIDANLADWSATEASNSPAGTDTADLDADLRRLQAAVRKYMRSPATPMASGTSVDLSTADGDYVSITGTTTIEGSDLGTVSAGMRFILVFAGALVLTHNATSLILPGASNITTAAGDVAWMESLGSGNWKCIFYSNSSGVTFLNSGTSAVTRTVKSKLQELPVNVKDFGCVGDGVTDDTTAYTAALTEAVNNKRTLLIPVGNYLISAENYDVRGDFMWRDTGLGVVDAIGQAEINSILITGKTEDSTPTDAKKSLTLLSLTADLYGSHHGNAARFNAVSRSDNAEGTTSVYVAGNTTSTNNWMGVLHTESKHGGGTTIALNVEAACYESTGTFHGVNIQNSTGNAATTHPQTSGAKAEVAESKAINIQGTGADAHSRWKYGIYFADASVKTAAMQTGSAAIRTDAPADFQFYVNSTAVSNTADIYLSAASANGLVCTGNYSGSAIRIPEEETIGLTNNNVVKFGYVASGSRIQFITGTSEVFGIDMSSPALHIQGTKVIGPRGSAIANAAGGTEVATINSILGALRTHGLIAT